MKTSDIFSLGTFVVTIFVAGLTANASAREFPLNRQLSPSHLHAVCDQNGGAFGMAQDGSGICVGKTGDMVICSKQSECVGVNSKPIQLPPEDDASLPSGLHDLHPIVKDPSPAVSALGSLQTVQLSN